MTTTHPSLLAEGPYETYDLLTTLNGGELQDVTTRLVERQQHMEWKSAQKGTRS